MFPDNQSDDNVTEYAVNNSERNSSENNSGKYMPSIYNVTMEDSNWIMTSAFIIFTMQTGR